MKGIEGRVVSLSEAASDQLISIDLITIRIEMVAEKTNSANMLFYLCRVLNRAGFCMTCGFEAHNCFMHNSHRVFPIASGIEAADTPPSIQCAPNLNVFDNKLWDRRED